METKRPIIGILGGMGPAASAEYYKRLVLIAQHTYGADQDTDFPPMYLYSQPLLGFDETGLANPELVREQLVTGVRKLAEWGSSFIVIPCNTVHIFYNEMQKSVPIEIVSIVDAVVARVLEAAHAKVGLLSSQSTREYQLYERALAKSGIEVIDATDAEQKIINDVIHHVMNNSQGPAETTAIVKIAERMITDDAEAIVIGCTELPLAVGQSDMTIALFNSIDILAEAALDRIYSSGKGEEMKAPLLSS